MLLSHFAGNQIHRTRSPVLLPTPELTKTVRELASSIGARLDRDRSCVAARDHGPDAGPALRGRPPWRRDSGARPVCRSHATPCARCCGGRRWRFVPGSIPPLKSVDWWPPTREPAQAPPTHTHTPTPTRTRRTHTPRVAVVPPGVDTARFRPLDAARKHKARQLFGLPSDGPLVVSVSRLVPRKGMDVLIRAGAALMASFPDLTIAIGGVGRDHSRLQRLIGSLGAPVRLLGRVEEQVLPDLYGASDVFVMACRDRWHGLEQEGFGIVFLEAAACGVPQVAGRSGGAAEAVVDGRTGIVVDDPADPGEVAAALRTLLSNPGLRALDGGGGKAQSGRVLRLRRPLP